MTSRQLRRMNRRVSRSFAFNLGLAAVLAVCILAVVVLPSRIHNNESRTIPPVVIYPTTTRPLP